MKERKLGETILDERRWWQNLSEKEREDFLKEGVLNFKNFSLSKDHWREELETVRRCKEKLKKVGKIADKLGMPIEQGIKETVVMLNAFDLRTSGSYHIEF